MSVVKRFNTRANVAALQQNRKNWEWKIPVTFLTYREYLLHLTYIWRTDGKKED